MQHAPSTRDTIYRDGTARLLRFRRPHAAPPARGMPLLIVPSMINRWYIVDLRPGASLVAALLDAGVDVYCLDWGVPEAEDRDLSWTDVVRRATRAIRRTRRDAGSSKVAVLGYCMGGTVAAIATALQPEPVGAFVNLAGPIDFSQGGTLTTMTDPRWFDAEAMVAAGNLSKYQMQSGFVALRPTTQVSKWVALADGLLDKARREAFLTLENWANDNVDFPGAAYRRYITDLYQRNELVRGEHHVAGERVDLGRIACPVLVITAERDHICPPAAAIALAEACGSTDTEVFTMPGGHVGCVVGSRATRDLYPALCAWLGRRMVGTIPALEAAPAPAL
jgi:polyhydroxyalkanoate synthase